MNTEFIVIALTLLTMIGATIAFAMRMAYKAGEAQGQLNATDKVFEAHEKLSQAHAQAIQALNTSVLSLTQDVGWCKGKINGGGWGGHK